MPVHGSSRIAGAAARSVCSLLILMPRPRLHVLTLASGAYALLEGMLCLLSFADAAPLAYVEGVHNGRLLDDPAMVDACHTSYTLALSDAAPREVSVALVRSIAKEHEHAQHRAGDR
ncbi:Scr1 family TA system antitoxin-like transcriptional regulator [Streptomyces sp. NPDC054874]